MKYYLLFAFLLCSTLTYSQSKQYLDENRSMTKKKDAKYVQTVELNGDHYILKEALLSNGQLISETELKSFNPMVKNGVYRNYFNNGQIQLKGHYANDVKTGIWESYYKNGQQESSYTIVDDKNVYNQYWSENGKEILFNGEGKLIIEKDDSDEIKEYIFRDSLLHALYNIRPSKNDTIYTISTTSVEYKNGLIEFYKGVVNTVRYPANARRNGIQGKVYVQFIVNRDGELEEIKTVKGIGYGCDEEAEKALLINPKNWIPAKHEGKNVKSCVILPINFKLG